MLKIDSDVGVAIGFTSTNFSPTGSFIWDLRDSHGYLAIMRLVPVPGADRPIAHLLYRCESLDLEVRFYDFPRATQEVLLKSGFEKVTEKCGTTYLHNRARLKKIFEQRKAKAQQQQPHKR